MSASKRATLFLVLSAFVSFTETGICQQTGLRSDDLLRILAGEVAGEEAFNHVIALAGWPRLRSEAEYTGTFFEADYVLKRIKEYGLDQGKIEYFPWEYQNWAPQAAELRLVEPEGRELARLDTSPLCLIQDSRSADVQAEVVDVGQGISPADYEGKDVKGKIVLASGYEGQVNHEAVHLRGALGIIDDRSLYPDDNPDNVSWGSFSQLIQKTPDKFNFGFMISPRQGHDLRRLLKEGKKVVAKARVETKLFPGKLDVVSALIQGKERPEEEVLLLAHLFEFYYMQGANDNSSGSAAILEAARALNTLIKGGKIPPPRRSIRFFWEPEGFGTFAYLAKYPEAKKRFKAVVDMDMVGEGHRQCGSVFDVLVTPDSLPHFFGDVVGAMAEDIKSKSGYGQRMATASFSEILASPSGSRDPFYCDVIRFNPRPFNEYWLSVPHILFHCAPDPYYHSIQDRPDKCDPTQLKRAALLGAAAAYFMADVDSADIPSLAALVLGAGEKRLAEDKKRAIDLLARSNQGNIHRNRKEALNILHFGFEREEGALNSIGAYAGSPGRRSAELAGLLAVNRASLSSSIESYYSFLCRSMGVREAYPAADPQEVKLSKLIPKPVLGLEFSTDFRFLERALGDEDIQKKLLINGAGFTVRWEALNFADGKRSLLDIRNALSAEFSPAEVSLEMVEQYFKVLEKAGVVAIKEAR